MKTIAELIGNMQGITAGFLEALKVECDGLSAHPENTGRAYARDLERRLKEAEEFAGRMLADVHRAESRAESESKRADIEMRRADRMTEKYQAERGAFGGEAYLARQLDASKCRISDLECQRDYFSNKSDGWEDAHRKANNEIKHLRSTIGTQLIFPGPADDPGAIGSKSDAVHIFRENAILTARIEEMRDSIVRISQERDVYRGRVFAEKAMHQVCDKRRDLAEDTLNKIQSTGPGKWDDILKDYEKKRRAL